MLHRPHSYLKTVGNMTLSDWNKQVAASKVNKESRFKRENPFYMYTESPGPCGYNLSEETSLSNSNSKLTLNKSMMEKKKPSFGNPYDKYKNVYYPELSKDFANREGPGPGRYDSTIKPKLTEKKYSFPKNDRKLGSIPKTHKNTGPSPSSYKYEDNMTKIKGAQSNIKFGTSERNFDFTKCKYSFVGFIILDNSCSTEQCVDKERPCVRGEVYEMRNGEFDINDSINNFTIGVLGFGVWGLGFSGL